MILFYSFSILSKRDKHNKEIYLKNIVAKFEYIWVVRTVFYSTQALTPLVAVIQSK